MSERLRESFPGASCGKLDGKTTILSSVGFHNLNQLLWSTNSYITNTLAKLQIGTQNMHKLIK